MNDIATFLFFYLFAVTVGNVIPNLSGTILYEVVLGPLNTFSCIISLVHERNVCKKKADGVIM